MAGQQEFAPLYSRAERNRKMVLAVVAGAIAVVALQWGLFPAIRAFAQTARCQEVFGTPGLIVLWNGLFVGLPMLFALLFLLVTGQRGVRILRDGQVPYIGEKMYRATAIRRGSRARLTGWMHLLAFVPFLLLAVWGHGQARATVAQLPAVECQATP